LIFFEFFQHFPDILFDRFLVKRDFQRLQVVNAKRIPVIRKTNGGVRLQPVVDEIVV
jgi:hypothetical protein